MAYIIGISSGIWTKGKEGEEYAGLGKKIYAGAVHGVRFVQLDIQHLTEFREPGLKEQMDKILKEGYTFAIHGECASFGTPVLLDSSLESEYKMAHEKVVKHVEEATKYGAKYVLFHSSESTPFPLATGDLKEMRLVDPWGNKFNEFLEKYTKLLNWAIDNKFLDEYVFHRRVNSLKWHISENIRYYIQKEQKEPTPEEMKKIEKISKEDWQKGRRDFLKSYVVSGETFHLPDRIAYPIVAKWMDMENHPLWKKFVGKKSFEDVQNKIEIWVPAVSAMYTVGHFSKKCNVQETNLKDLIEKNKMMLVFETPMPPKAGYELYMRMPGLLQIYDMISHINSDYIGMAVDFEHLITSNLDPKDEIAKLPGQAGKKIVVIHCGAPIPYATAHAPVELGSDAQKYIYERLWELRKKGFRDGIIIYERGGGEKSTIISLRKIKEYLERDMQPNELPLDFFGLAQEGPEIKRQELAIKQHTLDPLKGLLTQHEEERGVFSEAAFKRGKSKEWKEEEYR